MLPQGGERNEQSTRPPIKHFGWWDGVDWDGEQDGNSYTCQLLTSIMSTGMRDQRSLAYLKRADDEISEVLGSAAHVTMYTFDNSSQKWNRSNCEGPLFVVKRNNNPRFQMIVMNRLSRENEVHNITASFFAELIEPYLIFKSNPADETNSDIHGSWFPDQAERQQIFQLLQRLISAQTVMESDNIPSMHRGGLQTPAPPEPALTSTRSPHRTPIVDDPQPPAPVPDEPREAVSPQLLTPAMILGPGNVPTLTGGVKPASPGAASKATLKAALMSLLDDETFMDMVHQKYKSLAR